MTAISEREQDLINALTVVKDRAESPTSNPEGRLEQIAQLCEIALVGKPVATKPGFGEDPVDPHGVRDHGPQAARSLDFDVALDGVGRVSGSITFRGEDVL